MSVPIVSVAGMRAWEESTWAAGVRAKDVIARVGLALSVRLLALTRPGDRLLILAGRGNNGADTRAAVPHLGDRVVEVLEVSDPSAAMPALASALRRRPTWVVDGLFGIGLNRPLSAEWCRFIEDVNAAGARVVSMDVPSGLNADTGGHWGAVIRAEETLSVGAPKCGLLATEAAASTGRLEVARDVGLVGVPEAADERDWMLPSDASGWPPPRRVTWNKGDLGKAVIVAGSVGYSGAAVLALRAASRARPGLLGALVPEEVHLAVSFQMPSAMVHPYSATQSLTDRATAILAGPGLAAPELPAGLREDVIRLWREFPGILVMDASSLDWISGSPETAPGAGLRVITPHPGEAARLLGVSVPEVQADRPAALRNLARRLNALVVLKGHQTLIGGVRGRIRVNSTGNPGLAQGGTGDILAGFVTGLLAQPHLQGDPERTVALAVWEHGRSADRLESVRRNWTAQDLADAIGA